MSHLFPERIETERLELDAMTVDSVDLSEYYRICSGEYDPDFEDVVEYMPWEPHATPKETLDFLAFVTDDRENDDGAEYVIRPKDGEDGAGEIAGATGLTVDWGRRSAELGIWLRRPFWGRGYSGERAAALFDLAFQYLDLDLVAVTHVAGNEKSRRAIEKYVDAHGGRREGILRNWEIIGDEPADLVRYSVSQAEYENATDGQDRGASFSFA